MDLPSEASVRSATAPQLRFHPLKAFIFQLVVLLFASLLATIVFAYIEDGPELSLGSILFVFRRNSINNLAITLAFFWGIWWSLLKLAPSALSWLLPFKHSPPGIQASRPEDGAGLEIGDPIRTEKLEVLRTIDQRIERLRGTTLAFLFGIALSLITGAFVIIFAGRLTSLDASAVSNVDRIKSDLADESRRLSRLYQYQSLFTQIDTAKNAQAPKDTLDKLDRQVATLQDLVTPSPPDLATSKTLIADEKELITNIHKLLDAAWTKELSSDRGYNDWHYIAATAITRVGVVLIIVYLVQILMGLYRYNTRLISYYSSRRDLLVLWDGKQRGLKPLDEMLASSQIDFGKEPKHPLEDLFKALGSKVDSIISGRKAAATGKQEVPSP